jgi:hypothetical protein
MNPNTTNTPAVDSVQNKGMLWTTLQESGAFAGLSRDQFQPVQSAFDRAVQQAAAASSNASLSDVNKGIIREFMQVLRLYQMSQNNANNAPNLANPNNANNAANQNNAQKKKKIELVYRAEDLQNERASEFDRNLREKQAEMDSFLTLKKPNDVSFADTAVDEDKPIGDEMARLIAQELAARERELVQLKPEDIKKAQQWIGATASATASMDTQNVVIKKSVSFSEDGGGLRRAPVAPLLDQFEVNVDEHANEHADENFEEIDIFSKFKKLSEPSSSNGTNTTNTTNTNATNTNATNTNATNTNATNTNAPITIQQIYNKLIELEQRMDANHAEIMEHLHSKGGS